jgi:nitrate/nitrite-specific signal transduction histidine kinase
VESARFQKVPADQLLVSNQGRLLLQVKDNGQGREASRNSRKRRYSESYGMRTISDRLRWIERKFRVSAKMEVLDLKDEKNNPCGTAVVLNLPLIETDRKFV